MNPICTMSILKKGKSMMQRHFRIFRAGSSGASLMTLAVILSLFLSFARVPLAGASVTAQHEADSYTPGDSAAVSVTIDYDDALSALGMRVCLPEDWSYEYCTGTDQPDSVQVLSSGQVEFAWVSVPDPGDSGAPLSFAYLVQVPESEEESCSIEAQVFYRIGDGAEQEITATPDPLTLSKADSEESVSATQKGEKFVPGELAGVEITVTYSGTLSALAVVMDLPDGWSFAELKGDNVPYGLPDMGDEESVEFYWIDPPSSPVVFTCRFQTPEEGDSEVAVSSQVVYRRLVAEEQVVATPDPLEMRWVAPVVEGISPVELTDSSQTQVVEVSGRYFVTGSDHTVRFISSGNVFEAEVVPSDSTRLTVAFPSGVPAGLYRIRVIHDNGSSDLSEATLRVVEAETPLPVVTDVRPQSGSTSKAVDITICGEHFTGLEQVCLSNGDVVVTLESFVLVDDSCITATVPEGCGAGPYEVLVTCGGLANTVSTVKFHVCSPVVVDSTSAEEIDTESIVSLDEDLDGTLPVTITMNSSSDKYGVAITDDTIEVEAVIEAGTRLERADGSAYSGDLMVPVQVKVTDEVSEDFGEEDVVMFEMGSSEERIFLSGPMVVTLTITRSADGGAPRVYYLEADGTSSLAGIAGVRDGVGYVAGGTVLEVEEHEPEEGYDTYRIGLLIDHMSTFVVGKKGSSSSVQGGDGGGCFIRTSGDGLRDYILSWDFLGFSGR